MSDIIIEAMTKGKATVIPVRSRHIIKEGDKYKVYLPTQHNELWELLRKKGKSVDLIIIVRS